MEQDGDLIPEPTPVDRLAPDEGGVVVMVEVFMPSFRERMKNKSVNRTVTLPAWLNAAALEREINFSQVLQDAIKAGSIMAFLATPEDVGGNEEEASQEDTTDEA